MIKTFGDLMETENDDVEIQLEAVISTNCRNVSGRSVSVDQACRTYKWGKEKSSCPVSLQIAHIASPIAVPELIWGSALNIT